MQAPSTFKRGFTIVELLIVIVVIAILATVGVLGYNGVTRSGRDVAAMSDAEKVAAEVTRYGTKNGGLYGSAIEWYSQAGVNQNINFTPTSGNIVDVVSSSTSYCVRVYNPGSGKYKTLQTAATAGSSSTSCASQQPSVAAQEDSVQFTSIVWQQVTGLGVRNWVGSTSSDSGQYLATAAQSSYVYTSNDAGVSWVTRTTSGSRLWTDIDSSTDGSKLIASTRSYLFYSGDYGATWTQLTSAGNRDWRGVTISYDGTKLATQVAGGYIYTSTDTGASWVERTSAGSRNWDEITGSDDGATLFATSTAAGSDQMLSQDSGATWTSVGNAAGLYVYGSDLSSDGTVLAMTRSGVGVSEDSGATWTVRTGGISGGGSWYRADLSGDGTKMVISKGYLYTSTDMGSVFTLQSDLPLNNQHYNIDSSSSGAKIIASGWGGYVYIGTYQ